MNKAEQKYNQIYQCCIVIRIRVQEMAALNKIWNSEAEKLPVFTVDDFRTAGKTNSLIHRRMI